MLLCDVTGHLPLCSWPGADASAVQGLVSSTETGVCCSGQHAGLQVCCQAWPLKPQGTHLEVLMQAVACHQHVLPTEQALDPSRGISKEGEAIARPDELLVHGPPQLERVQLAVHNFLQSFIPNADPAAVM